MNDWGYRLFMDTLDLFLWDGDVLGAENLPQVGPAVLVANHLDSAGPIATGCSLPMRLHAWIIADMMDRDLSPDYMRQDFIERQLHFKPPLSRWISRGLCRITIPLFDSLGCIPVYHGDYARMQTTYEISLEFLKDAKFLVIFPEDNSMPLDPITKMQPFKHSFVRLAEMYYAETGKCLGFYPVAVHESKYLAVGRATFFDPDNHTGAERRRIKNIMEMSIRDMYKKLEQGDLASLQPEYSRETPREIPWQKSTHDV